MRYNAPYGVTDADAGYVNGDPSIGQKGSIPPAAQMEYPQREIINAILSADLTPTNNDLTQLAQAIGVIAARRGVYFVTDTGTANQIVGTVANPPQSFADIRLVVVKKMASPNAGAMQANLFGLGLVALHDHVGDDFAAGVVQGGGIYLLAPNGSNEFRILGGSTTVNNVSSVTNTSGKAITVASGGGQTDVDMTHSTTPDATPDPTDLWMRQDALKNILTMSTTQLIAWLNGALSFLSSVPPNGPGTAVGQFCWQTIGVTAGHVPAYAGFSRGVTTATAAEMQNGQWPGVDQSRVKAWAGVNSADYGFSLANWYAESGFNEIAGTMAGTWLYVGCFETVSLAMWNQYVTLWLRLPD